MTIIKKYKDGVIKNNTKVKYKTFKMSKDRSKMEKESSKLIESEDVRLIAKHMGIYY